MSGIGATSASTTRSAPRAYMSAINSAATAAPPKCVSHSGRKCRRQMTSGGVRCSNAIAPAIKPVFRTKYVAANAIRGASSPPRDGAGRISGPTPASQKKQCAAAHIASAGAAALNRSRCTLKLRRASWYEMTRASIATATVPASGP